MNCRVFVDESSGRVVASYRGPRHALEAQPLPPGCYEVWTDDDVQPTPEYRHESGKFVHDPVRPVLGYQDLRRREYPPVAEQLDAIWKELAISGAKTLEGQQMLQRVLDVKARHPKPGNGG